VTDVARLRVIRERRSAAIAAGLAVLLIAIATYIAFVKGLPLQSHFEVRATVASSTQLHSGDPVRIAGIEVGEVHAIDVAPGAAQLTLRIDSHTDELHDDASLSIEPRLLLEGNNYVDLRPGTPGAPPLRDGDEIPLARTTVPVQVDQLLSTLTRPTRASLQATLDEFAAGLGGSPSGAAGLRRAARELDGALGSIGRTAQAARGEQPGDLHRAVAGSAEVMRQVAADPAALADLVTDFHGVFGALAAEDRALAASIRELGTLTATAPPQLRALDAGLVRLEDFSPMLRPALQAAPGALRSGTAMLEQLRGLVGPGELPALLGQTAPVTAALPGLEAELGRLLPHLTAVGRCTARNIVPTLNEKVPDGALSTSRPAWQDMLHMAAALTGTSPGFDGNGGTLRLGVAQGPNAISASLPGVGPLLSSANVEGVRPTWLGVGVAPQFRPEVPCTSQTLPDLSKRDRPGLPEGFRAIAPPSPTAAQQDRRMRITRLLFGSDADRARLVRMLGGAPARPQVHRRRDRPLPGPAARPAPAAPVAPAPVKPHRPRPVLPILGPVQDVLGELLKPPSGPGLLDPLESILRGRP
jgi:virulence factor Mce-like protein